MKHWPQSTLPDRPIDSHWSFGGEPEPLMHRIHAYPAKFPAFITTKAVAYAEENGVNVSRIADVFCGCGTTALEAKRLGVGFWGCDINPVATLIARVKREDYQLGRLQRYATNILTRFDRSRNRHHCPQPVVERIRYWHSPARIRDLQHLVKAVESAPTGKYRDFFLCAFSNILKPTSRWLTKSIKPQIDPNKSPATVRRAFESQLHLMFKAVAESVCCSPTESTVRTGNFLGMRFPEPIADLVITSPPYVTSYEYADLHQLSTMWLGYTNDYRTLRQGTIGSLYHNSEFTRDIKELNRLGEGIVFRLYDADRRKAHATAKYFADIKKTIIQCRKLLYSGGMVLFVIGNTEYKGVKVDNAQYVADCLSDCGFGDIHAFARCVSGKTLTPYRDRLGRFTSDASSRKVYAEECIVTGRNL